ncbi:hypothetical protein IOC51_23110 [Vibrio parahaemolyticus]|uniref:hypothetical protein n=1 Tax=Vibrio parahaemolyticus TaxID=670 RepID=UPI001E5F4C42|nr:hypothetical protein [Vibrio parahaemolyticus]MCD1416917.1 hypothetical protein [Vibrio parahaemolyticus]
MTTYSRTMDAIPANAMQDFLAAAKARGGFWYDMFFLCAALGLRNSECRELKRNHIDWNTNTLHLRDSKSTRAFITRHANQYFESHWLSIGRRWLREHIRDRHISLIVRLVDSGAGLVEIAQEYGLESEFALFYQQYRTKHLPRFRVQAEKTAPKGRVIDLTLYPKVLELLKRRDKQAASRYWNYLFSREALGHGRAMGDKPVSRQMVYHICCQLREGLATKLKGVRIGLHSCRKFAVQRVVSLTRDVFTASVWVGHGHGRGNLAMTEHYLNRSAHRQAQVSKRLGAGIGQFE